MIVEALASGTPVAGFPVTGPIDIVGDGMGGAVSEDLRQAALAALEVDRADRPGARDALHLDGLRGNVHGQHPRRARRHMPCAN